MSRLRVRLLLLLVLILLPSLVLIFHSASENRRLAVAQVEEESLRLAHLASASEERWSEGARNLLLMVAQLPEIRAADTTACNRFFANLLERDRAYLNFGTISPDGEVLCSGVPIRPGVNVADRAYFRRAVQTKQFAVGEYELGRVTGKPALNFALPLLDRSSRVHVVVFASLDLNWLHDFGREAHLPLGSSLLVIDRQGTILARYPDPARYVGRRLSQAPIVREVLTRGRGVAEVAGVDGVARLYAFTPLHGATQAEAAFVSVGIPHEAAFGASDRATRRSLTGLACVALLSLVGAWFGSDVIILRRVKGLIVATRRLGEGDLSARTGQSYAGELGELARSFDDMAASLETSVAERRRAERSRSESDERFALLVEGVKDYAILMLDPEGHVLSWNAGAQRIKGYVPEEILGRHFSVFYPEEDRESGKPAEELRIAAATGRYEEEGWRVRKDGSRFWAAVLVTALHDETGALRGYAKITRDVTERRIAEDELREREQLFDAFMNNSPAIAFMKDDHGRVVYVNERFERMFQKSLAELRGKRDFEWLPEEIARQTTTNDRMVLLTGETTPVVETMPTPDGVLRHWLAFKFPFASVSGERFLGGVAVDITERVKAEDEVRELNAQLERRVAERTAQLEAANRELESFSYSVSHDLRAPLRSVKGFSQVLLEDHAETLGADGRDALERVCAATGRMSDLIDDMLKLSRITRSDMRQETVDLSELARNAADELRKLDPRRHVEFAIQDGLQAKGDARLLRIVLENLLGNAWKFTSKQARARIDFGQLGRSAEEHPSVRAPKAAHVSDPGRAHAERDGGARPVAGAADESGNGAGLKSAGGYGQAMGGEAVYYVRDNGAGFDMKYAGKLFGAFQRLHAATEFVGTGVGLATVQRVISRHGGRIWATAAVGHGATFYFTLEAQPVGTSVASVEAGEPVVHPEASAAAEIAEAGSVA